MSLAIERIDHIVMTVNDIAQTVQFYCDVLGMREIRYGDNRSALAFGQQKINLHPKDSDIAPRAAKPTAGAIDICLVSELPIDRVVAALQRHDIAIETGPVERQGALGSMQSVYFRDPDGNLIEVSHYSAS
jgi:catechol 2,3-dioxygenase-like lactoylglutathione lyase family enzyme